MSFTESDSEDENISDAIPIQELLQFCEEGGLNIVEEQVRTVTNKCNPPVPEIPVSDSSNNQVDGLQVEELGQVSSDAQPDSTPRPSTQRTKLITPKMRIERKSMWRRTLNKEKRLKGEAYVGFKTVRHPVTNRKNTLQTELRMERSMGPTCNSAYCKKSVSRNCSKFSEVQRSDLFNEYWKIISADARKPYIRSLVDKVKPRALRKEALKPRTATFNYFLKLDGKKIQVCNKMFLNTFGIGRSQVQNWMNEDENKTVSSSNEAKASQINRKGGDSCFYKEFLQSLNKMPSHYCRADTSKEYLEPFFKTKADVYKAYCEECVKKGISPTSTYTFSTYFDKSKYGLHQPKKDKCDICCSYEAGNLSQAEYDVHMKKKELARKSKEDDKKLASKGQIHCITMDVQKVLLSPMLNASALYYKTKLSVHNFTINDIGSQQVMCYLFDESEAELVSSTFASCVMKYFAEFFDDDLPIVIYSDGCTNQNRNGILSAALLNYAVSKKKVVFQKFLEKGHTQMQVDHVHALIEKKIRGCPIYVPQDYVKLCEEARHNPEPFKVSYLSHADFKDYSKAKLNIRPGTKTGDSVVVDLRQIKYTPEGQIFYKLDYSSEWEEMPRGYKTNANISYPNLYSSRLPIPKRKYQDLQDLLHVIPENYHIFYNSLPYKTH